MNITRFQNARKMSIIKYFAGDHYYELTGSVSGRESVNYSYGYHHLGVNL